jgi:hypothetical protein
MTLMTRNLARQLRELIAALDRRVPRTTHAGELTIAREAAALREAALDRLKQVSERPGTVAGDMAND